MAKALLERLRGARRIELFAALALAALLALILMKADFPPAEQKTELEARVERILTKIEGAGRVSAMITQDAEGGVTGALIVADGLNDMGTYLKLQRAVESLLEVDASRIEIIGRSDLSGGAL